ncbi:hypothetical protein BCV72DRAFT_311001 [Rhizopus microsporus var. microsporus]|uniref:PX domain-containing protein n=2 Tax=Rhizopus microsporus TaxID=58291 RepID=A0A2G4SZM4_RHIZD|nr:uncharacterized protein RHIMIDRAFT_305048 [Rhizopus microsporus ATCC 52813]ORE12086.1 hypothetical protein BCV72DRAFT_311001 [Rhizopus microsporus var. microsporus]PHZ14223.1 hypothetical protein RHIMIDRAFT_305048 [Rhizopus microsporus ATCC 52813]
MSRCLQFSITHVDYKRKDPVFWIDVDTTITKFKQKQKRIPRYYSELQKLHSQLVSTLNDVWIPALPACPIPRFDKGGNLLPRQWWLTIKLSNESKDITVERSDPPEYRVQLWMSRIAKHERVQQSEVLREFVESEVGFRPTFKVHKLSKPLLTYVSEQDMDPEFTFWTNRLSIVLHQLHQWLIQNNKFVQEHKAMSDGWINLSSSFVSFGAMEGNPELFISYKSLAKAYQQLYDIQRSQALVIYETVMSEISCQIKNTEAAQNAMQRRLIALSEYISSRKHTESCLRQVERLKSSINIDRERANEAITLLENAKINERGSLQHYERIDGHLREDIEFRYKPNLSKDIKRALREYATGQLYLEKKKLMIWQEILNENKVIALL